MLLNGVEKLTSVQKIRYNDVSYFNRTEILVTNLNWLAIADSYHSFHKGIQKRCFTPWSQSDKVFLLVYEGHLLLKQRLLVFEEINDASMISVCRPVQRYKLLCLLQ